MTREQNEKLAVPLSAIMNIIDNVITNFSIEELRENLTEMERQRAIHEALPFPSTQNAAQKLTSLCKTYKAIVSLVEIRKNQSEFKPPFVDDNMLRDIGIL
jgi:hypothetical protein